MENVFLIPCNILSFDKWIPYLQKSDKQIVFTSCGFLMYLKPAELRELLNRICSLGNFSHIVGFEPYNIKNIEKQIVTKEEESFLGDGSYYHNYKYYLKEQELKVNDCELLFDGTFVWFSASK